MPAYGLDAIFDHYVQAVLRRAEITQDGDRWHAHVHWTVDLTAHGRNMAEARDQLKRDVSEAVFTRLRHGQNITVIDGIDLNGGSC